MSISIANVSYFTANFLLIFKLFVFIYLCLAVQSPCCCAESLLLCRLFSSYGERGCSLAAGRGFLIAVASLVAEHGL